VQRLDIVGISKRDLVIVVDTSGSMTHALQPVVEWLARLEKAIVDRQLDTQLLVLADQRSIGRKANADGGINWTVGSYDALNVLLLGARGGGQRWADYLRTNAELMLVVVTDDRPYAGSAPVFQKRITEALGGMPFTFHVLGGFEAYPQGVLTPDQPIATAICAREGIQGMNIGEQYQELARLTKGTRASLCFSQGRDGLTEALLATSMRSAGCAWLLNESGHRIDGVSAVSAQKAPYRLLEERSAESCAGMRRSYRMAGGLLALCEDTCGSLKQDGYEGIEVKLECLR
jgi:hypothetical protein